MKTNIEILHHINDWKQKIPDIEEVVIESCKAVLQKLSIADYLDNIEISVLLGNDDIMRELNLKFRNKDRTTNVLSFPNVAINPYNFPKSLEDYRASEVPFILGDIILSLDMIEQEVAQQKKNINDHLKHLIIHSMLHLLGFDHADNDEEAQGMEKIEIEILKAMSIENPYIIG